MFLWGMSTTVSISHLDVRGCQRLRSVVLHHKRLQQLSADPRCLLTPDLEDILQAQQGAQDSGWEGSMGQPLSLADNVVVASQSMYEKTTGLEREQRQSRGDPVSGSAQGVFACASRMRALYVSWPCPASYDPLQP